MKENSYSGLLNNLNVYTSMKTSDLNTIGLNMMYKSTQTTIADTMVPGNFANNTNEEFIVESVRHGIHMMGPLNFFWYRKIIYLYMVPIAAAAYRRIN